MTMPSGKTVLAVKQDHIDDREELRPHKYWGCHPGGIEADMPSFLGSWRQRGMSACACTVGSPPLKE